MFGIYAGTGEKEVAELMPVVCDELTEAAGRHDGIRSARVPPRSCVPRH